AVGAVAAAAVIVRVAVQLVPDMGDLLTERPCFPRIVRAIERALGRVDVAVEVASLVGGETALTSEIVGLVANSLELLLQLAPVVVAIAVLLAVTVLLPAVAILLAIAVLLLRIILRGG